MPRPTGSSFSSTAAGVPRPTRSSFAMRRSRSTAQKRKLPAGWPPPRRLLTCRATRSTSGPPRPRRGCPSTAPPTGSARSTATNPGTTNCARKPAIAVVLPRTPTRRRIPRCSLGAVFDHVAIAVADLAASERFYRTVLSTLGAEPSHADAELVEWEDWDIGPADPDHPLTRGLHVGFRAPSREAVDAFWQAGIDAGYRDDGAPGPRTVYGADYYGGFLLDPDGNSAEAVHTERENP